MAVTCSSDGKIHIYNLSALASISSSEEPASLAPIAVHDTKGSRLTCLSIIAVGDGPLANDQVIANGVDFDRSSSESDSSDEGFDSEGDQESSESSAAEIGEDDAENADAGISEGESSSDTGEPAEWGGIE